MLILGLSADFHHESLHFSVYQETSTTTRVESRIGLATRAEDAPWVPVSIESPVSITLPEVPAPSVDRLRRA
jgi:hypothetical protein